MMSIIEEKIIKDAYMNILTNGEYPQFGSPEVRCDKCMFYKVVCYPSNETVVGCFHGWRREKEK